MANNILTAYEKLEKSASGARRGLRILESIQKKLAKGVPADSPEIKRLEAALENVRGNLGARFQRRFSSGGEAFGQRMFGEVSAPMSPRVSLERMVAKPGNKELAALRGHMPFPSVQKILQKSQDDIR